MTVEGGHRLVTTRGEMVREDGGEQPIIVDDKDSHDRVSGEDKR